jgi:hypothetical protein
MYCLVSRLHLYQEVQLFWQNEFIASDLKKLFFLICKNHSMSKEKGKPSGINKSESVTGTPSTIKKDEQDNKQNDKYTKDGEEEQLAEGVRIKHPNRNVDKNDATNAGGYKN